LFFNPQPEPELEWRLAYSGPDRATEVRDLHPAAAYRLRVCAINAAGASPFSGCAALVTPPCAPGPVGALTPLEPATTATQLSFKFKKPASHGERIEEYNVEWTDKVRRGVEQCSGSNQVSGSGSGGSRRLKMTHRYK
jgi:hypothetical protein